MTSVFVARGQLSSRGNDVVGNVATENLSESLCTELQCSSGLFEVHSILRCVWKRTRQVTISELLVKNLS